MTLEGIDNLNLNVTVTVFAPDHQNQDNQVQKILRGQIHSNKTDQSLVIQLKTGDSSDFLTIGKPIFLFLAHDLGIYLFSAMVSHKTMEKGDIILRCRNPRQIKYFQRRESVRVNVRIPVGFTMESNRAKTWDGIITNISMGGLQLAAPFLIPEGSVLELVFELEDAGPIFMDGKVVRAYEKERRFIHGIQFVNLDRYPLDGIAKFVLTEQIRQKRLGLQFFTAFIFDATMEVHAPTVFTIIQHKNHDVLGMQGKECNGNIMEIGIDGLVVECPFILPVGSVLEFSVEMPQLGYSTIQARVREVSQRRGKFLVRADYCQEYEKIRDCILADLAKNFNMPQMGNEK